MSAQAPPQGPKNLGTKTMTMNIGPQHPATHGTLHLEVEVDGEIVVRCRPHLGYLHTGFEKLAEYRSYNQFITLSDRLNYLSSLNNNIGFALAVEEMLGVEITPRCRVLRVILAELGRLGDHVLSVGLQAMDLGAFSVMLWAFVEREKLYDIFEATSGGRLTTSWTRIGGLSRDVPDDFIPMVKKFLEYFPGVIDEVEKMLNRNRIFTKRTRGVGVISRDDVIAHGVTGPIARGSGLAWDIRRVRPYLGYELYDFEVPVEPDGDVWSRYRVRVREMRESIRILNQAIDALPDGPVTAIDTKFTLPDKLSVYNDMEALIHHFKLIMHGHGFQPAPGEIYASTESPNGELGWFIVSDGTRNPYRLRCRPPSFINYTAFPEMVRGGMISDLVAVMASLNVIAGELDR
ncbi:MAG: NADH-quinone oxidoreductase subunit D [Candidatus Brocadiae bacterium]|nr:NADH-quinone oxidoreductase subunit D [Candidatus Brocadiia bacterium]